MLAEYRLTLDPKTLANAGPEAHALLEAAKAQVGFIPNMYARMANSPGLLFARLCPVSPTLRLFAGGAGGDFSHHQP